MRRACGACVPTPFAAAIRREKHKTGGCPPDLTPRSDAKNPDSTSIGATGFGRLEPVGLISVALISDPSEADSEHVFGPASLSDFAAVRAQQGLLRAFLWCVALVATCQERAASRRALALKARAIGARRTRGLPAHHAGCSILNVNPI